jgi:hypothetical protein
MNMKILLPGLLLLALCSPIALARGPLEWHHLASSLQCLDRRVELRADCYKPYTDSTWLECTSQRLDFFNVDTGKKLNSVVYPPAMGSATKLAQFGLIEHKVLYLGCNQTAEQEKYFDVLTNNGKQCDDCERAEVFSWDGVFIGRRSVKVGNDLVETAAGNVKLKGETMRRSLLLGFFSHSAVRCDGKDAASDEQNMGALENELNKNLMVAFGMMGTEPDATQTIDPVAMANMASLLACAAAMENTTNGCFGFQIFSGSPKDSALYRQFVGAIGQLPAGAQKKAAQRCL